MSRGRYALAYADILRRMAYLRINQFHWDQAIELSNQASYICRQEGSLHRYGEAVVAKGVAFYLTDRHAEAVKTFAHALCHLNPKKCAVTYHGTLQNLLVALVALKDSSSVEEVYRELQKARKALPRDSKSAQVKLKWADGITFIRFGSSVRAIEVLRDVAEKLAALGTPHEQVLVAIDLAQAYYLGCNHLLTSLTLASARTAAVTSPPNCVPDV